MLSKDKSYRTISMTLLADGLLFILILAISFISKSAAVFSEALYQLSDLASGGLLLFAIWSSLRPADELHHFGYGLERFFWSFVSGVFVFSVSGAVVVLSGLFDFFDGRKVTNIGLSMTVLGITIAVSTASLLYIIYRKRRFYDNRPDALQKYHQGVRTVLLQDVMSIASSFVAVGALALVSYTGYNYFDSIAAVINGILLLVTGIALSAESRGLLIGRGLNRAQMLKVTTDLQTLPDVNRIREIKSIYLGPESLLIVIRINFRDGLTTDQLEKAIDKVQLELVKRMPEFKHVIVEPES